MIEVNEVLKRQREWSRKTFGEGRRTEGVCKHIESELAEIRSDPADVKEWVDVIILAMDGYWRGGGSDLERDLTAKMDKNRARSFPKPVDENTPSFHVKGTHD